MKKSRLLGAVCACLIGSVFSTFAHAVSYTITDLGTLGSFASVGRDINNSGQIAGESFVSNGINHAFIYDGNRMLDIGTLGGPSSDASSINNSGYVTGSSNIAGSSSIVHAFIYDGDNMVDIGTLGGTSSYGTSINDSGQVTGLSNTTANAATHAFIYDSGNMIDIGTLFGGASGMSYGNDINNNGYVTGFSGIGGGSHAFIYDGNGMADLGTLGGTNSTGTAINDSGLVTGYSQLRADPPYEHAFIYDGNKMVDLGTLEGGRGSRGYDINSHGHVVGSSGSTGGAGSFLFDGDNMLDLCLISDCTSYGWTHLSAALAINDNGDITGAGIIDGEQHAFLLSAVPIPPALWLFGSGLLGLIGIARKK